MKRELMYSVSDLKDRGWTDTAVKRFLPETPDDSRDNPRYRKAGAPMKFWKKTRVHRAEKTKSFAEWKQGTERRQTAALAGVATRVEKMIETMKSVEIEIDRSYTTEQIRDLAIRTHGGNYGGEPGPFAWSSMTARNCIRHNLTNYEHLWSLINRGETGREPYDVLRKRVDLLIDEAYPQFADSNDVMLQSAKGPKTGFATVH